MKHFAIASLLIGASLMSVACKQVKQVEEMHDRTVIMSENTASMAGTTAGMAATTASMSQTTQNMELLTEDLRELSAWMFNILKQGDTSRLRDEAIKDMMASESFPRKSLMATKYFYAFEYQIWNSPRFKTNIDTLQIREKLKAAAVIEYAKTLSEFLPTDRKETGVSDDEQMKNLYALVASMHKINDYQQDLIQGTQVRQAVTVISMFSILDEGLSVLPQLENGEITRNQLTPSQIEVLREEDTFIYALKLRAQFLPAFALSRISGITDASLFEKATMLYFKWTPDLLKDDKMNLEEVNYATEILRKTIETQDLLKKRGIEVKFDKKVLKIFKNMNRGFINQDKLEGEARSRANLFNRALTDFYQNLDQVLK